MSPEEHKQAVLDAHSRYAIGLKRLKLLDEEREHWQKLMEAARVQLDVLATRAP